MSDYDPKRELQSWADAKKAALIGPRPREIREALFLSVPQFCQLLGISKGDYVNMVAGEKELSFSNKLFLVEALRIAREKGLITDERY